MLLLILNCSTKKTEGELANPDLLKMTVKTAVGRVGVGKVLPHSLPSIGHGADCGVQAVSPQVA